jgi:hypothetical protein
MRSRLAAVAFGIAVLSQACVAGLAATDTDTDPLERGEDGPAEEPQSERLATSPGALGFEDPYPAPALPPPGGPAPGGPGGGWTPAFGTGNSSPGSSNEVAAVNGHHVAGEYHGRAEQPPAERAYAGGATFKAPPSPRWLDGPLNDKGRCLEVCFAQYLDDSALCKRLPDVHDRGVCQRKAIEDYALCVRECGRKYPGKP